MRQMFERLPVLFQSATYSLRGGFLVRPLLIALVLGIAGAVLSSLEEAALRINVWIPNILFLASGSRGCTSNPQQHRYFDNDRGIDRLCDAANDSSSPSKLIQGMTSRNTWGGA